MISSTYKCKKRWKKVKENENYRKSIMITIGYILFNINLFWFIHNMWIISDNGNYYKIGVDNFYYLQIIYI